MHLPFPQAAMTPRHLLHHHVSSSQQQPISTRVFHLGPVRLKVECVEAFRGAHILGDGVDATGVMLWPGSLVLCAQLLQSLLPPTTTATAPGPPLVDPSLITHVVELGAGATGLAGLLASRLLPAPARATLTERDAPSLALLRGNAARVNDVDGGSSSDRGRVAVRALCWGDEAQAEAIVAERGAASLCLGADILYPAIDEATVSKLLRSARRLLQQPTGRLLLRYEREKEDGGRLGLREQLIPLIDT